MNRRINYIDYSQYENQLSCFGKKVLNVLRKQRQADHERRINIIHELHNVSSQQSQPQQHKKFMTFGEPDHIPRIPSMTLANTTANNNITNTNTDVPTSLSLIKAIENNPLRKQASLDFELPSSPPLELPPDDDVIKTNDVNWNNIFDVNILSDTDILDLPKSDVQDTTQDIINAQEILNTVSPIKETIIARNEISKQNSKKQKEDTCPKRPRQTKITDAIPKKIKKTNSIRKQKYTKTVQNWLDGVEPPNQDKVIPDQNSDVNNGTEDVGKDSSPGLKTSKNKKVVQAQLANKGGIMKYGQPKNLNTESKSKVTEDVPKVKPAKSKFIAPVKSQLPVQDVNFEIITIDEHNIEQLGSSLLDAENSYVCLLYRNGFSQLNCQYTENTCETEGIMVSNNDIFFYVKDPNVRSSLNALLKNRNVICYDGKHVVKYLCSDLYDISFNVYDLKVGSSLVDPDHTPENFSELQKLVDFSPKYTIATECVLQKCAWYMTIMKECAIKLITTLKDNSLWKLFVEIEMKLLPILADMEQRGISVDVEKLKSMEKTLLDKIKTVEQRCYKAAGKVFQVNSALQVRNILYDELKLDAKCNVQIRETLTKGAKSTSETMLRSLMSEHELPKLILEYRHLHKAHATFLTGISQHVKDGIVKPTWEQNAAATGRISSNNPNLQAIPKALFSLEMFPENDIDDLSRLNFRSLYRARAGFALLAADFRHAECRVFARASADAGLQRALDAPDLFRRLAAARLNKPEHEVSAPDRELTKRLVYATLYGAGPRKLMDILQVNYDQTRDIISSFNRTFPSLKSFGRSVIFRCIQDGGRLTTPSGRARRFHNITSEDPALRAQAERQAVNFIIQGSAADLCKSAMTECARRVPARLVLQIHDELVWELCEGHQQQAAEIIKEEMENCGKHCGLPFTVPVSISYGKTWGEMIPWEPSQ